jgi:uncharacterized protein YqeY
LDSDSGTAGLKEKIEQDLKTALLAGDKDTATVLRGLKGAILNAEIAAGKKDSGLEDNELLDLLAREAKKRQESADLYIKGGEQSRADTELKEKTLIEKYLPQQLSEDELIKLVDEAVDDIGKDPAKLGQIIGAVKQKAGAGADGAVIARLVKEKVT